jgi:hypothetical protein
MENDLRKKYVCTLPFTYTEISDNSQWLCCPSWLPQDIKETDNYKDNWYSDKSNKIRESILDGSYKYCDSKQCPYLSMLDRGVKNIPQFVEKGNFLKSDLSIPSPKIINFGFDTSCNLQCPSCRLNFINLKGEDRTRVNKMIKQISENMGDTITIMTLCGAADPFFSKSFFNFMREFDDSLFPKLTHIHLHTNANLWTPSNWERISKVHKYVKTCEISIDAATKDTYENKVRIKGDWDKLINNINFIVNIPNLKRIRFSFVVQKRNYKEMYSFYEMITNLTKGKNKKIEILYNAITDWGAYPTKELFLEEEIHNPNHPMYDDFLIELERIRNLNVYHNFSHIIPRQPSLI